LNALDLAQHIGPLPAAKPMQERPLKEIGQAETENNQEKSGNDPACLCFFERSTPVAMGFLSSSQSLSRESPHVHLTRTLQKRGLLSALPAADSCLAQN